MAVDPKAIEAVRDALRASPRNIPLRLHLAGLLLEAGFPGEALSEASEAHCQEPDHLDALAVCERAATAAERHAEACGYGRLLAALRREEAAGEPVRVGADPVADAMDGEFDDFMREVLGKVTLDDVGGLDEVKRRLRTSFLGPMRNPELRRLYGKSLRGGLLLYGPPGCGKTFVARAVAGELDAAFFVVGLHDVLDMWLGQSERNLHAVFETARRSTPCVLFLDEIDALGMKRSNLSHSAGRNVVVQLLNELDSIQDNNDGLFVLGATNQPWDVDSALRRPGRFDRMLLVLPPDESARCAIVEYHLRGRPADNIDIGAVASRTDGYSGADLRLVCEAAAERALEASVIAGSPLPITTGDLLAAVAEVSPSTGPWFDTAHNVAIFGNHDGTYDELATYMRRRGLA